MLFAAGPGKVEINGSLATTRLRAEYAGKSDEYMQFDENMV